MKKKLEQKKNAISNMIDDAILTVKNEIEKSDDNHKVQSLIKIEYELKNMKKSMSPNKYLPDYGYIIVECWDDFANIGQKLLKVLHEYKEKLL